MTALHFRRRRVGSLPPLCHSCWSRLQRVEIVEQCVVKGALLSICFTYTRLKNTRSRVVRRVRQLLSCYDLFFGSIGCNTYRRCRQRLQFQLCVNPTLADDLVSFPKTHDLVSTVKGKELTTPSKHCAPFSGSRHLGSVAVC